MIIVDPADRAFTFWQILHRKATKRCKRCAELPEMCEVPRPYSHLLQGNYQRALVEYENRTKRGDGC